MDPKIIDDPSKCYYCERRLLLPDPIRPKDLFRTIDHVIPLSKGGKNVACNRVFCCYQCNQRKGNKLLHEWEKSGPLTFKSKRINGWASLRPLIIQNLQNHPLYGKENHGITLEQIKTKMGNLNKIVPQSEKKLKKKNTPESPTMDYKYLYPEADIDPYNFHIEYPPNKRMA